MTMLTAGELTQLRSDVTELLPDTCNIIRNSIASNEYGDSPETGVVVASGAACRVDPFGSSSGQRGGIVAEREASINLFQLTIPWSTDVLEGDRVSFSNVTYEIIQLSAAHSNRLVKRAVMAKIQGA